MPCDPQCRIKEQKIAVLQQMLEVTEELGQEVARSKRQIMNKMIEIAAEIAYFATEITWGCNPCQISNVI